MKRILGYLLDNSLMVNIISVALLIAGLMYMVNSNREAFPKIDFGYVLVTTVYPGATASDVEKLISIPVEDSLRETNGLEEVQSYSDENMSTVVIKIDPDVENDDKVINDIKSAVDKVTDLPDDAQDPVVTELSMAQEPVITLSLINKNGLKTDKDEFEMRKYLKVLENKLKDIPGVAKIKKNGYRDREMMVEVDLRKLDIYRVALNDIIYALSNKNVNFPGGVAKISNEEVMIRTIGEVQTAEEIGEIVIRSNDLGNYVRIRDVAQVKDTFEDLEIINKTNGGSSISMTILKKESSDIIDTVGAVRQNIKDYKKILPENYDIVETDDLSYFVERRLDVLTNNAIVGIILVVLSLFIAFGWRIAVVTAVGIPVAFAGTFYWMGLNDININLMSMFGLIMVLGMVVDDAIIVAENIYRHIEDGEPVRDAVINGTSEVIIPVAGTIMTTIAAFAPLMFMSGIMGKFMWVLPAVVSLALIMSWIEAMFILPSHVHDIEKNNRKNLTPRSGEDKYSPLKLRLRYSKLLKVVLKRKFIFLIFIFFLFAGSLSTIAMGLLPFELFPASGIEKFIIRAEAPVGTTLQEMSSKVTLIESELMKLSDKELESFTSQAGISSLGTNDPESQTGANYGSVIVNLTSSQGRKRKAKDIIEELRKNCEKYSDEFKSIEFKRVENGPPTGDPVSITIKGDDFEILKEIAKEYKDYLSQVEGVKDIKDSLSDKSKELQITVNSQLAAKTGISVMDVATTVRSCYAGTVATEIKKTDEEIDVRVILPEKSRNSVNSLYNINISNRMGNLIPLRSVAKFKRSEGLKSIQRKDWQRFCSVTADLDISVKGANSYAINRKLMSDFKDISSRYPGYEVSYVGEFEDTNESFKELGLSFIIAIMVIYIILVGLFKSLHHPLLVMSVIPLTAIGVIWAFVFHNFLYDMGLFFVEMPLSFMSLMGVVGLAGVVVNDSIVMVDFINKARMKGMNPYQASVDAGAKRLRPIILTTLTTVLGLLPTAYGIGGLDEFLIPMAVAMSFGLLFGTFITLFFTPVLYNSFYSIRYFIGGVIFRRDIPRPCYEIFDEDYCTDVEAKSEDKTQKISSPSKKKTSKKTAKK